MAPRNDDNETEPDPNPAGPVSALPDVATPPGPIQLEIRVNGKIACLQRVHSYTIDQDTTQIAVYGQLTPQTNVQP